MGFYRIVMRTLFAPGRKYLLRLLAIRRGGLPHPRWGSRIFFPTVVIFAVCGSRADMEARSSVVCPRVAKADCSQFEMCSMLVVRGCVAQVRRPLREDCCLRNAVGWPHCGHIVGTLRAAHARRRSAVRWLGSLRIPFRPGR